MQRTSSITGKHGHWRTCSYLSLAKLTSMHRRPTISSFMWAIWLCMPDWLRLSVYKIFKFYYGKREFSSSQATRLPFGLYAKHSEGLSVAEAFATQFVSLHTTIPVPTVLDVLVDSQGLPFILMTRVPGRPLPHTRAGSLDELSDAQCAVFADTLRGWLTQLRQLEPPSSGPAVCGYMGTPFFSYRISYRTVKGPYATVEEFHSQSFCKLPPDADEDIRSLQARIYQKPYRVYFAHGDLTPNNILVDKNYVPCGLIDFGCAAWLPEYWELAGALFFRDGYVGWTRALTRALPDYEDELEVERELWKSICPY